MSEKSGARSRSSYRMKRAASSLGFTRPSAHGTPQLVNHNMARQRTESTSYFSTNVHRGGTVVQSPALASSEGASPATSNTTAIERTVSTPQAPVVQYASNVATPNGSLQRPTIVTTSVDESDPGRDFTFRSRVSSPRPTLGFRAATTQILTKTFSSPGPPTSKGTTSPTSPVSPGTLTVPKPVFTRAKTTNNALARPSPGLRAKTSWSIAKAKRDDTTTKAKRHDSGSIDAKPTVGGPRYEASPDPPHQRPRTGQREQCVYVLTLKMDEEITEPVNRMREMWFPKALNRTPAHLTLFHAIPHSQLESVDRDLSALAARTKQFQVAAGKAFRMRRGVGISLGAGVKEVSILHDALRTAWLDCLSAQDSGPWRPHWTVQNKEDDEGRRDEAMLNVETVIRKEDVAGRAQGLDLWKYDSGNWWWEMDFVFTGSRPLDEHLILANVKREVNEMAGENGDRDGNGTGNGGARPQLPSLMTGGSVFDGAKRPSGRLMRALTFQKG